MSAQAGRLCYLRLCRDRLRANPSRSHVWQRSMIFADADLRAWAGHIIGWGC